MVLNALDKYWSILTYFKTLFFIKNGLVII